MLIYSFEGVCVYNCRHPGPRHVWEVGSEPPFLTPLPWPPWPPWRPWLRSRVPKSAIWPVKMQSKFTTTSQDTTKVKIIRFQLAVRDDGTPLPPFDSELRSRTSSAQKTCCFWGRRSPCGSARTSFRANFSENMFFRGRRSPCGSRDDEGPGSKCSYMSIYPHISVFIPIYQYIYIYIHIYHIFPIYPYISYLSIYIYISYLFL